MLCLIFVPKLSMVMVAECLPIGLSIFLTRMQVSMPLRLLCIIPRFSTKASCSSVKLVVTMVVHVGILILACLMSDRLPQVG